MDIELNQNNLLGILFAKLDNYEKAHEYLTNHNPSLYKELMFIRNLQMGQYARTMNADDLISHYNHFEEFRLMHNNAIIRHYASTSETFNIEKTKYFYDEAIKSTDLDELKAFTSKHYALLMIDSYQSDIAVQIIEKIQNNNVSTDAKVELDHTLSQALLQKLTMPYDQELLDKLKDIIWNVNQAYEKAGRTVEEALSLLDASHIANISNSYAESLGYLTKAIKIFEKENLVELAGNAQYRRGILLYTWAQKGNPQFFKPAIESFQHALKVFTKNNTPDVFADIHHYLGVLYSEMPSELKKKSIWAGVSVSSFDEALAFYTKDKYPHQYGMICNNYGNAFTKYPQSCSHRQSRKSAFLLSRSTRCSYARISLRKSNNLA